MIRPTPTNLIKSYSNHNSRPTTPMSFELSFERGDTSMESDLMQARGLERDTSEVGRDLKRDEEYRQQRNELPIFSSFSPESSILKQIERTRLANFKNLQVYTSMPEQHQSNLESQIVPRFFDNFDSIELTDFDFESIIEDGSTTPPLIPPPSFYFASAPVSPVTPTHLAPIYDPFPHFHHESLEQLDGVQQIVGLGITLHGLTLPGIDSLYLSSPTRHHFDQLPTPGTPTNIDGFEYPRNTSVINLDQIERLVKVEGEEEIERKLSKRSRLDDSSAQGESQLYSLVLSSSDEHEDSYIDPKVAKSSKSTSTSSYKSSSTAIPGSLSFPTFTRSSGSYIESLLIKNDITSVPTDALAVVWDATLAKSISIHSDLIHHLRPHSETRLLIFPKGTYYRVLNKKKVEVFPWSTGSGANDWVRNQGETCSCKKFKFHQGKEKYRKHPSVIRDHVAACISRSSDDPLSILCKLERKAEKLKKRKGGKKTSGSSMSD